MIAVELCERSDSGRFILVFGLSRIGALRHALASRAPISTSEAQSQTTVTSQRFGINRTLVVSARDGVGGSAVDVVATTGRPGV